MDSHPKNLNGFLFESDFPLKINICNEPLDLVYNVETRPFARGKFAQVRRCRHKQTGIEYAGKVIKKRRRSNDVRHEIIHEICVLMLAASNESIVNLHEVYETPTEFILILEMIGGGEVQRVLDSGETIKETIVIQLIGQILYGLSFLHNNNIAHLDIKPQNLLLTKPLPEGKVKLCDFGISRRIFKGVELREIVGTPDYVAPEILNYEPITLATDMWSLGVLTYVLLTGYSPFAGETKQETFSNITSGVIDFGVEFDGISANAIDFIKNLLQRNPENRMSVKQCLEHRWINDGYERVIPQDIGIKESDKENLNLVVDDFEREDCMEKRDYYIYKVSKAQSNESQSLPSTPSCKRLILEEEEERKARSERKAGIDCSIRVDAKCERVHCERKNSIGEKNSILFESNTSLTSFAGSTYEKPYRLIFREDIIDERVSYIY